MAIQALRPSDFASAFGRAEGVFDDGACGTETQAKAWGYQPCPFTIGDSTKTVRAWSLSRLETARHVGHGQGHTPPIAMMPR